MLYSLLNIDNCLHSTQSILDWIKSRNEEVAVKVERVKFSEMKGWFVSDDGSLRHKSGKFFSIEGIHVRTDYPDITEWEQPIINQPEIGYLGILTKEINGILYFLMQAKIEPGNVNCVQISPTLQATKSNYMQVHGGKQAAYLDFFRNATPNQIVLDQLQSEQGARFLKKRNRNIIIRVDDEVPVYEDFCWMTLGQIKEMMRHNNLVNMDTRTVISGIDFSEFVPLDAHNMPNSALSIGSCMLKSSLCKNGINTIHHVLSWLTSLKATYDLSVCNVSLNKVRDWVCSDYEIYRPDNKYFRVIGVNVNIENREVTSWSQPLIEPMQQGICAFIIKKIDGIFHFLVQAKLECGNLDVFELAPTVQCLTGNIFKDAIHPPFTDYVLNASPEQILYDTIQSEEGGRFFHEQNRNMLVLADDLFPLNVPPTYQWLTLGQINELLRYNNYLNIQARSLIAAIKYF